jgi:hypothetical protein
VRLVAGEPWTVDAGQVEQVIHDHRILEGLGLDARDHHQVDRLFAVCEDGGEQEGSRESEKKCARLSLSDYITDGDAL